MDYTKGEFKAGEIFEVEGFGWNAEIMHKDHRGFFAQISGNTKEEAEGNLKIHINASEMYEVLLEEKENLNNDLDDMIKSAYNVHAREILENRIKRIELVLDSID